MSSDSIDPLEAQARMQGGAVYLDLRAEPEFEAGHPSGAFNVPWPVAAGQRPSEAECLAAIEARFAKTTPLIVGCAAGMHSRGALEALRAIGYDDVVEASAGFVGRLSPFGELIEPGWSALDLPTDHGRPPGRSWKALARVDASDRARAPDG